MVTKLEVESSRKKELVDITDKIESVTEIEDGEIHIFVPHHNAGVFIGGDEEEFPELEDALESLLPDEGKADHDHIEDHHVDELIANLLGSSETVLVDCGRLDLGAHQRIFMVESDGPAERTVKINQHG